MGLCQLYSNSVQIKYKSNFCSAATLFTLIINIVGIILPLVIAYRSRGFWLKNYVFYEQPIVRFKYQYLLVFEMKQFEDIIKCGNIGFNTVENSECSITKIKEIDYNLDGKIDEFYFTIEIDTHLHEVAALNAYFIFDVQLQETCGMQMEAMTLYGKEFALSGVRHSVYGDLNIMQRTPLQCILNSIDTTYNNSVFLNQESGISADIHEYFKRNVNMYMGNIYQKSMHGKSSNFQLEVRIHIPEQEIRFKPGFFQEMKWAWMQYFSIAVIFYFITNKIKLFIFRNRLVMAWEMVPWQKD